ncbi:hypothetical protein HAX54_028011, partial [Datura stramonium]|nr:hypothetical protein [Datura stramonium]
MASITKSGKVLTKIITISDKKVDDAISKSELIVEDNVEQEIPAKLGKLVIIEDTLIDAAKSTSVENKGKGKEVTDSPSSCSKLLVLLISLIRANCASVFLPLTLKKLTGLWDTHDRECDETSHTLSQRRNERPKPAHQLQDEPTDSKEEGLTTTGREHLKRSFAKEVRIIESELFEYPPIEIG